jgi:peptidoglycan/xylan/chitin deacetylase (PgdA/CDA1 family)
MNNLTNVLDKYKIKTTLFVDAAYLLRLNELSDDYKELNDDFNKVKEHILLLHKEGHDIQLHFHPQWIYSVYSDRKWELDFNHYKLSDMDNEFAFEKFEEARVLLERIIDKKIIVFRAGGYSIDTLNNYIELFKKNGIKIDSSVARGSYLRSNYHSYDYRKIPQMDIYHFSTKITREDQNGEFTEFSISTKYYFGFFYLIRKFFYKIKYHYKNYGDGDGVGYLYTFGKLMTQIKKIFIINLNASFDGLMVFFLPEIFKKKRKNGELVIISHPKGLSNISIDYFEKFIRQHIADSKFLTITNTLRI